VKLRFEIAKRCCTSPANDSERPLAMNMLGLPWRELPELVQQDIERVRAFPSPDASCRTLMV